MKAKKWAELDLSSKPRMIVGRRKSSKQFDAHQVEMHSDLFQDVRNICQSTLLELDRRESRPYAPFAVASGDDYLEIDVSGMPRRVDHRKRQDADSEPAALLGLIGDVDGLASLGAAELRSSAPTMYAFAFEAAEGFIGFVRNTNPRRRVKPGYRYLRFENALRRMDPPDISIDDDIDIVVTPTKLAMMSVAAFNTLLGDVGVAFGQVPANAKVLVDALSHCIPMTPASAEVLRARCGRRVIDAKRLNHIASERATALEVLGKGGLTKILDERGLKRIVKRGKLEIDAESASEFLDAIEGRLFSDDVTGEERRADAYSPRRPK